MRSSVRELAAIIYANPQAVDLYELNELYGISPAEALFAAKFFSRVGILTFSGAAIKVSSSAKEWLHERRHRFFLDPRSERAIPAQSEAD